MVLMSSRQQRNLIGGVICMQSIISVVVVTSLIPKNFVTLLNMSSKDRARGPHPKDVNVEHG